MIAWRKKSIRRISILAAGVTLAGAGVAVMVHNRHRLHEKELQTARTEGMQAYHSGDYYRALDRLDRFLAEHPADDTEALLAFAISRARIESPGNQHLRQAIQKLDLILDLHPDNIQAKHALLEIYPQTTQIDLLEKLADEVLAKDANDELALRGRINVLMRQHKLEPALQVATKYADLRPTDLQANVLVLHLMAQLQKPAQDALDYVATRSKQAPNDPRSMLLTAFAYNYAGNKDKALWNLQQAAANPIDDAAFVRQLANLFDLLKRFDESQHLLETAAERTGDVEIIRALVTRLWQQGRNDEIDVRLTKLNAADPKVDSELVAMRAMALYQIQAPRDAKVLLDVLRTRKDRKAAGWVLALESRFEDYAKPATAVADKLTKALSRDPDNGIFKSWLAECYWNLGEASLSLRQWSGASVQMPSWSLPYMGMSQCLLQLGRTQEALAAAQSAFERFPFTGTAINLAVVRFRLIEETSDAVGARDLLKLVEEVQAKVPGEPRTLPIHIALLARTGNRDQAIKRLKEAAASPEKYDADTILRLISVSRSEGLGVESQLLDPTKPGPAFTPQLALIQAIALVDAGKKDEALKAIQRPATALADERTAIAWELSRAQFLDATNDPAAPEMWKRLGTTYTGSLDVQRTILSSAASIRADRAFVAETIERLHQLTGDDGQQWKLQRARWLIESPDKMKDGVEAVTILTEIVRESQRQIEPRLELARALERTGNATSAIEHLKAAQRIDPRSATVVLELVRLLQQQGQVDQVRDVLRLLASGAMMTARQRVLLASMYADIGENKRAIELLTPEEERGVLAPAGRLLLAEMYRRTQQPQLAEPIFTALLASPDVTPAAMGSAAEFYATKGDLDKARATIGRLWSASVPVRDAAIAAGRFEERFGDYALAEKAFRRAYDEGGEQGALALIDFLLRRQNEKEAAAYAKQAAIKYPESTAIANRVLETQALLAQQKNPNNLQPLIDALSNDPSRAPEVETLKAIADVQAGKLPRDEWVRRLRAIADKYPRFLPLQEEVIDQYIAQRRYDDAVTLARRAMEALPTESKAARLAVHTMRAARRWADMRAAAEQWKQRLPSNPLDADTAIAEALVELKQPDAAIQQLAPHRKSIESDVRTQPQAAITLARAMIANNGGNAARSLLAPLLQDSSGRRMWRTLALAAAPTIAEARAWCKPIEEATPADALDERIAMLSLHTQLARKFDDAAALATANEKLQKFLADRPADLDALMLASGVQMQLGQHAEAEKSLRSILTTKPDHPAACNDLAYLLISQNRDLDEAERLAQSAVKTEPNAATYHDTLARVLLLKGKAAEAQAAFETALKLNPDLLEARVGLARALQKKGDAPGANAEMKRVDAHLKANPTSGRFMQEEITSLRASLQQP